MQTLQWHPAWDKTISKQDRLIIEEHFHKTKDTNENITFISEARNHHQQLLVITIIHNRTRNEQKITNKTITYTNKYMDTWQDIFTVPIPIPANTSMPWTFIFSADQNKITTSPNKSNIQIKEIKECYK